MLEKKATEEVVIQGENKGAQSPHSSERSSLSCCLSGDQGRYQGEHRVPEGEPLPLLCVTITQRNRKQEVPKEGEWRKGLIQTDREDDWKRGAFHMSLTQPWPVTGIFRAHSSWSSGVYDHPKV